MLGQYSALFCLLNNPLDSQLNSQLNSQLKLDYFLLWHNKSKLA